jgi:hypothetical protein
VVVAGIPKTIDNDIDVSPFCYTPPLCLVRVGVCFVLFCPLGDTTEFCVLFTLYLQCAIGYWSLMQIC